MSEEEKKAIEYIKFKTITGLETLQLEKDVKALEILLNYIDTLQKENKELSQANMSLLEINQKLIEEKPLIKELTKKELTLLEKIDKLEKENEALEIIHETYKEVVDNGNFISKDKIRDKIEELEEQLDDDMFRYETMAAINVLEELLGE